MAKPNSSFPLYFISKRANNPIGNIGCKYLSRAKMPNITIIGLGKAEEMKDHVRQETQVQSTYLKLNGNPYKESIYVVLQ